MSVLSRILSYDGGTLAFFFFQAAKVRKASRIFAIDTNAAKFDLAKRLGATDCLNPKDSETPIQQVNTCTKCHVPGTWYKNP